MECVFWLNLNQNSLILRTSNLIFEFRHFSRAVNSQVFMASKHSLETKCTELGIETCVGAFARFVVKGQYVGIYFSKSVDGAKV